MNSPSIVSFTRKTPCVAGCCGPRLRTKVSRCSPTETKPDDTGVFPFSCSLMENSVNTCEVLSQRVICRILWQQQRREVRMSQKVNTKKLVCLTLMPVCSRKDARNRRHFGIRACDTSSDNHMQSRGRVEKIVNNFHFGCSN